MKTTRARRLDQDRRRGSRRFSPRRSQLAVGAAGGLGASPSSTRRGLVPRNDPNACANCHVMQEQLDGCSSEPSRGRHCNDCHTPPGTVPKYLTKAEHGFFTRSRSRPGDFHEPIQIRLHPRMTGEACRKCHEEIVPDIDRTARHRKPPPCRASAATRMWAIQK